jgi:hypothetical protein
LDCNDGETEQCTPEEDKCETIESDKVAHLTVNQVTIL